MKSAIIIGASSGIGRALAKTLSSEGYALGLASRRTNLLTDLAREIPTETFVKTMDVSEPDCAMTALRDLVQEMGDVELFVVNSGTGFVNHDLDWTPERSTIEVNVLGFTAMINVTVRHLEARGAGQLVGISSIAALRGNREAPAYGASKAFISNQKIGGTQHNRRQKIGFFDKKSQCCRTIGCFRGVDVDTAIATRVEQSLYGGVNTFDGSKPPIDTNKQTALPR